MPPEEVERVRPGRIRTSLTYDHARPVPPSKAFRSALRIDAGDLEGDLESVTQPTDPAGDPEKALYLEALRRLISAESDMRKLQLPVCKLCGREISDGTYSLEQRLEDGEPVDFVVRCHECQSQSVPIQAPPATDWREGLSAREIELLVLYKVFRVPQRIIAAILYPGKSASAGQSQVSRDRDRAEKKLSIPARRALAAEAASFECIKFGFEVSANSAA